MQRRILLFLLYVLYGFVGAMLIKAFIMSFS